MPPIPPLVIISGAFLVWITAKGKLQAYVELATKQAAGSSSSPTASNASPTSTVISPSVGVGSASGDWLGFLNNLAGVTNG